MSVQLLTPAPARTAMQCLLDPRSVAVIGASRSAASLGRRVLDALRSGGFAGAIYPVNVPALCELLLRVSQLVADVPDVVEMDLNPVISLPVGEGYAIVDARVRLASGGPAETPGGRARLARVTT